MSTHSIFATSCLVIYLVGSFGSFYYKLILKQKTIYLFVTKCVTSYKELKNHLNTFNFYIILSFEYL